MNLLSQLAPSRALARLWFQQRTRRFRIFFFRPGFGQIDQLRQQCVRRERPVSADRAVGNSFHVAFFVDNDLFDGAGFPADDLGTRLGSELTAKYGASCGQQLLGAVLFGTDFLGFTREQFACFPVAFPAFRAQAIFNLPEPAVTALHTVHVGFFAEAVAAATAPTTNTASKATNVILNLDLTPTLLLSRAAPRPPPCSAWGRTHRPALIGTSLSDLHPKPIVAAIQPDRKPSGIRF